MIMFQSIAVYEISYTLLIQLSKMGRNVCILKVWVLWMAFTIYQQLILQTAHKNTL